MHLSLWSPSDKLSTRLDNELDINLKLSINFSSYLIALPLSSSFLIGTKKCYIFLYFLPSIQVEHQILLVALWLWNDNQM